MPVFSVELLMCEEEIIGGPPRGTFLRPFAPSRCDVLFGIVPAVDWASPGGHLCRSALDEVANEDFHGNLVPSSDDEANDEADDHDSDDNLIEKPSRMPEPAAPVTRSARSQNTDGHDESKLRFKLVEDGEPDSDDEPETTEEFSTRQVKKDEAGVPQGQPSGPASFLKEYMVSGTLSPELW